ncbi:sensor histidine kinase [Pseudonocardia nigra]|uniref:sensor histidine kinase n=1 Tax=Pseudonocardia nigra TaxID=1921578 RepID=UPI001C5F0D29|nr:HAMP domain-containing sensor histidine kinase [Pseudonocardia nigra]
MRNTFRGRRRPRLPVAVDLLLQAALVAAAWSIVVRLDGGHIMVARAIGVLTFTAGVAASILLAVAAWMSGNRRARRIAAAVALYTGAALLLRAVALEAAPALVGPTSAVTALGAVGMLLLALRRPAGRADRIAAVAVTGTVALGLGAVVLSAALSRGRLPAVFAALEAAAWSATAVVGVLLFGVGARENRGLPRRVGLAFGTLAMAHAPAVATGAGPLARALDLAAAGMLLVAAVLFFAAAWRGVWRQQEATRSRLAAAEAAMASAAERDHEMRNLVAGLSGAASVLAGADAAASPDGRLLLVAAGAEIERLRRMLDGATAPTGEVAVGPLLRELGAVHRATGAEVHVNVAGDPHVTMDRGELAQVVTNLLTNCARHAPGASVRLRARERAGQVRIEVTDDGPGLPPGAEETLLHRGARGPDSDGSGLGLAISADLVGRHGGTFTLASRGLGCVAAIDLPSARRAVECASA